MTKWLVKMRREIEEPETEIMEWNGEGEPTETAMIDFFSSLGFCDDPEYSDYKVIREVS